MKNNWSVNTPYEPILWNVTNGPSFRIRPGSELAPQREWNSLVKRKSALTENAEQITMLPQQQRVYKEICLFAHVFETLHMS